MTELSDIELFEQLLLITAMGTPTRMMFNDPLFDLGEGEIPVPHEPTLIFDMVFWPVELFGIKFHMVEHIPHQYGNRVIQHAREHLDRFKDRDFREFWPEYFKELLKDRPVPERWAKKDWRQWDADRFKMLLELILAEKVYSLYGALVSEPMKHDWHATVMCNDTFFWASSDSELCRPEHISEVHTAFKRWGIDGTNAWCGVQRGMEPISRADTPEYREAEKWCRL